MKLNLNETKTKVFPAKDGFVFLGYYIDAKGKGPSKKAITAITQKLREISEAGKTRNTSEIIDDLKPEYRPFW